MNEEKYWRNSTGYMVTFPKGVIPDGTSIGEMWAMLPFVKRQLMCEHAYGSLSCNTSITVTDIYNNGCYISLGKGTPELGDPAVHGILERTHAFLGIVADIYFNKKEPFARFKENMQDYLRREYKVNMEDIQTVGQLMQWINDLQSGMYINCVYCGHRYGPKDEVPASMADVLKEHVEQCPEHPMSYLKAQKKAAVEIIYDLLWIQDPREEPGCALLGCNSCPAYGDCDQAHAEDKERCKELIEGIL